ncbi:MAG TPA: MEDS domain-containing protein [Casimicrobiaceae bacterium]|jgi:hypothetical protein|nr:MEDS domain-containing protein [Casimicrobiaceae bacterium]
MSVRSSTTTTKSIAWLPFIKDGFERGDKRFTWSTRMNVAAICNGWLQQGIDPTAAQQSGQFQLRNKTETYLRDGRFDQDRILEVFEQLASGNAKDRRQRQ